MTQHLIRIPNPIQSVKGMVLLLVLGLNVSIAAKAQSADIHGTIRDRSGGVIVGAKVSIVSSAGEKRETVTNGTGVYTIVRVALGEYFNLEIVESAESVDVSDMINVFCTVTDKQGRLITDLSAADFLVKEDGRTQRIARFANEFQLFSWVGPHSVRQLHKRLSGLSIPARCRHFVHHRESEGDMQRHWDE